MRIILLIIFTANFGFCQNSNFKSFGLNRKIKSLFETNTLYGTGNQKIIINKSYEFDSLGWVTSMFNYQDNINTKYYYEGIDLIKTVGYENNEIVNETQYISIKPGLLNMNYKNENLNVSSFIEVDSLDRIIKIEVPEGNYWEIYNYTDQSIVNQRITISNSDTLITNLEIEILEIDDNGNWVKYESKTNQIFPITRSLIERKIKY